MIMLRNDRYRAVSLFIGILLLGGVIAWWDLIDSAPARPGLVESVPPAGPGVSPATHDASFFQPIIQFTVEVQKEFSGGVHRTLPEEEAFYRRR